MITLKSQSKPLSNNDALHISLCFILIFILFALKGYIFVITGPQYATLSKEVIFEKRENSQNINEVAIGLRKPKSFFRGSEEVVLYLITERGNYSFLVEDSKIKKGELIPLKSDGFIVTDKFFPDSHRDCLSIPLSGKVNGYLTVTKYRQSLKSFVLEGEISIENAEFETKTGCYIRSNYENEIVTAKLNQTNISIKANSPVIYEWTGKGGPTYRL